MCPPPWKPFANQFHGLLNLLCIHHHHHDPWNEKKMRIEWNWIRKRKIYLFFLAETLKDKLFFLSLSYTILFFVIFKRKKERETQFIELETWAFKPNQTQQQTNEPTINIKGLYDPHIHNQENNERTMECSFHHHHHDPN